MKSTGFENDRGIIILATNLGHKFNKKKYADYKT
jgi:hypothetical protein